MSLKIPKGAVYAEFTAAVRRGNSFIHTLKYLDANEKGIGMPDEEVVSASNHAEWTRQIDAIVEELREHIPPVYTQRPSAPKFR